MVNNRTNGMRFPGPATAIATGVAAIILSLAGATPLGAEDHQWPREIPAGDGRILLYQPQIESFEENDITARAAISVTRDENFEPVFGAVWLSVRVEIDREARTVSIRDVEVPVARFPEATSEQETELARLVQEEIPKWDLTISQDRLLASLQMAEKRITGVKNLKMDPPKILFRSRPAVLVIIDGEPKLRKAENSDLQVVANTPFTIIFDPGTEVYYLDGGEMWFRADQVRGPWRVEKTPPQKVVGLNPPEEVEESEGEEILDLTALVDSPPVESIPPEIIVATSPTELIVTDGEPDFAAIQGTDLLYVGNTKANILLDPGTKRYYLLLSGRWFAATSLQGPWAWVSPKKLPKAFAAIPEESAMGHLLVHVPGTVQATEAILDAAIPQTSVIKRSEAQLTVTYDGDPEWKPIDGTGLKYSVNTGYAVILANDKYYCCDDGVWFVADDPTGPWQVADEIPDEIYQIPPSSPLYNLTYVHVYDSTPEVVYVGYTPGYTGSYVYYGTMVYGTGYYYPTWVGVHYYPWPVTYGFHVHYNPWMGWGFGIGYSTGGWHFRIGISSYGWWGPHYYRPYHYGYRGGYYHGYRRGYYHGSGNGYRNRPAHYNRPGSPGYRPAGRPATRPGTSPGNRPATRPSTNPSTANRKSAQPAQGRNNNLYADRGGNVYRRTDQGNWQKRDGNSWSKAGNRGTSGMNRDYQSRQRGSTRTNNYQRGRGGSPSRGGGGRRR